MKCVVISKYITLTLPATAKVAFLLTASPTTFLATHQYNPSSLSFLPRLTLLAKHEL